jgi:hypothetical protein
MRGSLTWANFVYSFTMPTPINRLYTTMQRSELPTLWLPIEGSISTVSSFATFLQSLADSAVSVSRHWKLRSRVTCRSNYAICHSGQGDAAADASVFAVFEVFAPPYYFPRRIIKHCRECTLCNRETRNFGGDYFHSLCHLLSWIYRDSNRAVF